MAKVTTVSNEEIKIDKERFIVNHRSDGLVLITRSCLDAIEALPQVEVIAIREVKPLDAGGVE